MKLKGSINYYTYVNSKKLEPFIKLITTEVNGMQKIIVLVGDKNCNFSDVISTLLQKRIKYLTLLQGGIDIFNVDEPSYVIRRR